MAEGVYSGVGIIGRDAELRFLQSGEPVINLSLAFNYGKRGQDGKRATQWVEAGLWGKRAESLAQHLTRGQSVWVTIEDLHIEQFNKADGSPGVKLAGRIGLLDFVGSRRDSQGEGSSAPAPAPARAPAPAARPAPRPAPAPAAAGGFDDMDDDIPFFDPLKRRAFALSI